MMEKTKTKSFSVELGRTMAPIPPRVATKMCGETWFQNQEPNCLLFLFMARYFRVRYQVSSGTVGKNWLSLAKKGDEGSNEGQLQENSTGAIAAGRAEVCRR